MNSDTPKDERRHLLRLPGDLDDTLRELATRHERSFNAEVIWALRRYVRAVEREESDGDG